MASRPFGRLQDGRPVALHVIGRPGGLQAEILDWGATVKSLRVPTAQGVIEVASGFATLAEYEADAAYHGVVVGRFANRIADARFEIDGETFAVTANEGPTCLHGGRLGLNKRLWTVERADEEALALGYRSPDGEEGFPGALQLAVSFRAASDSLEIVWEAQSDRPTPVNLTHHLYFNLSGIGGSDVLHHELTIAAEAFTPVDGRLIPTGQLSPVAATPLDFRTPRRIGERIADADPQLAPGGGYDHNWALSVGAAPAVCLRSPESGLVMEIETDQPGMQMYGGQGLKPPFVRYGALALEPQGFPDAVHHPDFPDAILRPGQIYRRRAHYRFSAPGT